MNYLSAYAAPGLPGEVRAAAIGRRDVTPALIFSAVAEASGVLESEWNVTPRPPSRQRFVVPRRAAIVLLRETGMTVVAIGAIMDLDHSTVSQSLSQARDQFAYPSRISIAAGTTDRGRAAGPFVTLRGVYLDAVEKLREGGVATENVFTALGVDVKAYHT